MKPVWAHWLAAAALLLAADGADAQPGGRFQERLREAERRFAAPKKPAARKPAARKPARKSIARKPVARKPAPARTARAQPKPPPRRTSSPPARVAKDSPPRRYPEPVLLMTQRVEEPTVTYSFEPRMPTTRMPGDTGDILFSTFPLGLKVYFEFERGSTSSTRGVLIEGLDPQDLEVRAYAPSLGAEIKITLPIQAGKMTQAQFFFPEPRAQKDRPAH